MAEWHPIMATLEGLPGTWRMIDRGGREYGRIEIRRVDGRKKVAYRAVRGDEVLGWAKLLRLACCMR